MKSSPPVANTILAGLERTLIELRKTVDDLERISARIGDPSKVHRSLTVVSVEWSWLSRRAVTKVNSALIDLHDLITEIDDFRIPTLTDVTNDQKP